MTRLFSKRFISIIFLLISAVVVIATVTAKPHTRRSIVINEVCTSNIKCCEDENGDFPDWIEIYNPTSDSIDLSGYFINDSSDISKEKYVFPEGTVISPGAFFLFDPKFKLSSQGGMINLIDSGKQYLDRIYVPKLKYDTTYARVSDGNDEWDIMTPTPGYSNSDGDKLAPVLSGQVTASLPSGFYNDDFMLELESSGPDRDVFYTIDGSDPAESGIRYDGPIHIHDRSGEPNVYSAITEVSDDYSDGSISPQASCVDKCTVIRAVAKDRNGRFTDTFTYTYFVGFDDKPAYKGIDIASITANPSDLFSYEDGIMVMGVDYNPDEESGGNYKREGRRSERTISVSIFDESRNNALEAVAGLRIKGHFTRRSPQKSFNVFFRKAYDGESTKLFSFGGEENPYHSLSFCSGGQDDSKLKDVLMADLMKDSECATLKSVPCALFVNGEYWGFYWLSERYDSRYFANRYHVNPQDVQKADIKDFESDSDWAIDRFDQKSFIDYFAGNIIAGHENDWPGYNIAFWKAPSEDGSEYGDGKLRLLISDMNSTSMQDAALDSYTYLYECFYPFDKYSSDDSFRAGLVNRINEMCAKEFQKDTVMDRIDELYAQIHDQMVMNHIRYYNYTKEAAEKRFDEDVEVIREFFRKRSDHLDKYSEKYLTYENRSN